MNRQGRSIYAPDVSLSAASVQRGVTVQHLLPMAIQGHADTVIVPRHRRKITDEQRDLSWAFSFSEEADHAALGIAAVHPLEAGRIEIHLKK